MSRSYKKVGGFCDRNPWAKRCANKRVRRHKGDLPDGCWYKRLYEQYDICDFKFLLFTEKSVKEFLDKGYYRGKFELFKK